MRSAAFLLVVLSLPAADGQSAQSARDHMHELQAKANGAAQAGDQQARIAAVLDLDRLLHGEPSVILAMVRAYTAAGDTQKALATLNRFANLGLADDNLLNGSDQRYAALTSLPEYKQVLDRFRRNEAPVSLGNPVFTITDPGLLTEDIDYDPATRAFLITSVLEHKIVRATLNGSVTDFASSPDAWPVLAIKIDSARHRAWATEVALDDFTPAPKDAWGRSAVLSYDLGTGKLLSRTEGPSHTALGDMVLAPNGDPIVSDGYGGIYRVSAGSLSPINATDFISPQTPVLLPGGDRLLIPDYVRGLAILNLATGQVSWLDADRSANVCLHGVDGVYLHNQQLILTQNGTTPQRVLLLNLDPSFTRITSQKVIEQSAPGRGDPTHGVVIGDDFYYIANSGWNQLDDHGEVKPGSKLTAAQILRYSLR